MSNTPDTANAAVAELALAPWLGESPITPTRLFVSQASRVRKSSEEWEVVMAEAYDREREENMRLRRALYALTCAVAADQTGSGSRAELLAENASALGVLFPDSDSPNGADEQRRGKDSA